MALAGAVRNLLVGSGTQALWVRGIRFGLVGATGYVVNVAVYSTGLRAGIDYRLAATVSFLVAASSNYVLNRTWTFGTSGPVELRRNTASGPLMSWGFRVSEPANVKLYCDNVGTKNVPCTP